MDKLILKLPEPDLSNPFTQEIVLFLGLCFLLLFGLLTCIIGFRCLKLMMMLLLGCASGVAGVHVAANLTGQKEVYLLFFVIFFFVGWGFIALLSHALSRFAKRAGIVDALSAIAPFAAALIGAGVVFGVVYGFVYLDGEVQLERGLQGNDPYDNVQELLLYLHRLGIHTLDLSQIFSDYTTKRARDHQ